MNASCLLPRWIRGSVLIGGLASTVAFAASPYLEFGFNERGRLAASSGNEPMILAFEAQEGQPADWHGTTGSGVSGLPQDRAFDNTASTAMGTDGLGGRAVATEYTVFPSMDSFTLSGWLRVTAGTEFGRFGRLFWWNANNQSYLFYSGLVLAFDGTFVGAYEQFPPTEEWVFFAATYDGTADTDNVRFYRGTRSTAVVPLSTATIPAGPNVRFPGGQFVLGNNPIGSQPTQPCDAWMDNFRVHLASGSAGALDLAQLEALRALDTGTVTPPVPASLAIALAPPKIQLSWPSLEGYEYTVIASPTLVPWAPTALGKVPGTGGTATWLDPAFSVGLKAPKYYRLQSGYAAP
ncbi:MAG TPA: hypothetical protein PKM73_11450 [Verrucomicrobiota bacterium]|nr:hypothetical protein [Verrucomicrobiota bacterium]HNU50561.1 hypothetical protein [Verrucomicrobiota bacterium]